MSNIRTLIVTTVHAAPRGKGFQPIDASRGAPALANWELHPRLITITVTVTENGPVDAVADAHILLGGDLVNAHNGSRREGQSMPYQLDDPAITDELRQLVTADEAAAVRMWAVRDGGQQA